MICGLALSPNQESWLRLYISSMLFFLTLSTFDLKTIIPNRIRIALARLRSKLQKYLRRKRQRNRLKIIAAQALSQVK